MRYDNDGAYDPQAQAVYDAEEYVTRWHGGKMRSHDEVKAFVKYVIASPRVTDRYGKYLARSFKLGSTYRQAASLVCGGEYHKSTGEVRNQFEIMDIPPSYRNPLSILHELSHLICGRQYGMAMYGRGSIEGHGWQFTKIMLALVEAALGPHVSTRLRSAYDQHGVTYQEPHLRRAA